MYGQSVETVTIDLDAGMRGLQEAAAEAGGAPVFEDVPLATEGPTQKSARPVGVMSQALGVCEFVQNEALGDAVQKTGLLVGAVGCAVAAAAAVGTAGAGLVVAAAACGGYINGLLAASARDDDVSAVTSAASLALDTGSCLSGSSGGCVLALHGWAKELCEGDEQNACQPRADTLCASDSEVQWVDSCGEAEDEKEWCPGMSYCYGGECVCDEACLYDECGYDECGDWCGLCDEPRFCSGGDCVCPLRECGGECCEDPDQVCDDGDQCCLPDCTGKICGDDGCGGSCGRCPLYHECGDDGQCACAGPSCGGGCCAANQTCYQDACCTPSCARRDCGPDGCGGSCGECHELATCQENEAGTASACVCPSSLCNGRCGGYLTGCVRTDLLPAEQYCGSCPEAADPYDQKFCDTDEQTCVACPVGDGVTDISGCQGDAHLVCAVDDIWLAPIFAYIDSWVITPTQCGAGQCGEFGCR